MDRPSINNNTFKLVFAGWWLVWGTLHYNVLLNFSLMPLQAFTDSTVSNLLLAACCLLVSNNMRYYLPRREKYWYVLAISFALSCIWLIGVRLLLWLLYRHDAAYIFLLQRTSTLRYSVAFLMVACMSTLSLLWYSQLEQKETDARKAEAEKMTKEAELFKLRQQLQPHFLFNSLNSISSLAGSNPEQARHMIEQLSDFLRGTLKKEADQWNSLAEELQYVQLYLEIEKVRFGHRLQTAIHIAEGAEQLQLPSLLLQPVVENAIKFGLYDTIGEVVICMDATVKDKQLVLTVQNPYDAETAQPLYGTGFGLASVKRRLYLLFARQDLLTTDSGTDIFTTTIVIPQPMGDV